MLELLGWLGSILLALCAVPEVISSYKTKRCGLTWGFLWIWYFGEIFTAIPVVLKIQEPFLVFNYLANIGLISYLIWIKFREKVDKH